MKTLSWLMLSASLVYVVVGAFLFFRQRSFIYFPTPPKQYTTLSPQTIENNGIRLRVWRQGNADNPQALIYFGGSDESAGDRAEEVRCFTPDHTHYLVEYRGYGHSEGQPSEAALRSDALAVYDALKPYHGQIDVVGRSIGTTMALYVTKSRTVERLALVTPHDNALRLAQARFPIYPMRWMLKDHLANDLIARDVRTPTLLLVAGEDKMLPPDSPRRLLSEFPEANADLVEIPSTGHNNILSDRSAIASLRAFFQTAGSSFVGIDGCR